MSLRGKRNLQSVEKPGTIVVSFLFGSLWLGFSLFMFYNVVVKHDDWGGSALFLGLFVFIGVIFVGGSFLATLEYFKYGKVFLLLTGELPAVGGSLHARLRLPSGATKATWAEVDIACIQRVWRKGNKGSTITEEKLWEFNQTFAAQHDDRGAFVDIGFVIPDGLPSSETAPVRPVTEYRWQVGMTVEVPGLNLYRSFVVHVGPKRPETATRPSSPAQAAPAAAKAAAVAAPLAGALSRPAAVASMGAASKASAVAAAQKAATPAQAAQPRPQFRPYEPVKQHTFWPRYGVGIFVLALIAIGWGRDHIGDGLKWMQRQVTGVDLAPDKYNSRELRLYGSGLKAEAHGADLVVRIDRISAKLADSAKPVEYFDLGFAVHRPEGAVGELLDRDVRGTLSAQSPELKLDGRVFVLRGAAGRCASGCSAKLSLKASSPGTPHSWTGQHTGLLALKPRVAQTIVVPTPAAPAHWDTRLARATDAMSRGDADSAYRYFDDTLQFIEAKHGPDHPFAAIVFNRLARLHARTGAASAEEQALLSALRIAERHSHADFQRRLGAFQWTGKENVVRDLAEFYLRQRRYTDALEYYRRAYGMIDEVTPVRDPGHYKRAANAAGIWAAACGLGDVDAARRAMDEFRTSTAQLAPHSRTFLMDWMRANRPPAARGC